MERVEDVTHRSKEEKARKDGRQFQVRDVLESRSIELRAVAQVLHALLDLLETHIEVTDAAIFSGQKGLKKKERV